MLRVRARPASSPERPAPGLLVASRFALDVSESTTGGRGNSLRIEVVDNQIEPALKALKREMLKGGIFKEMKRRAFYEKPSVKRKRKQAEARKKRRKAARRSGRDSD